MIANVSVFVVVALILGALCLWAKVAIEECGMNEQPLDDLSATEICERVKELDRRYRTWQRILRDRQGIPPGSPAEQQLTAAARRAYVRYREKVDECWW